MQFAQFRLVRYVTLTSLLAFSLVTLALMYSERQQGLSFGQMQEAQRQLFTQAQEQFARQQEEAARRDLFAIHESGNVNLTRLFANALWEKDLSPFVAEAQAFSAEPCQAIPDMRTPDGTLQAPPEKKACFAELGKRIMGLPAFKDLNAKVFDLMQKSTVLKIKVFDLRGITVYASEHRQIGEDKSASQGWSSAMRGHILNELTFREKFTAFSGVVENRDLISSYMPVFAPGRDNIVGVFELYSDVTPFLQQIKKTTEQIARTAAHTQAQVQQVAMDNQDTVERDSKLALSMVVGLLGLLYAALFIVVNRAQTILRAQESSRATTQQRLSQSEKMASLGQMVAGIAHQLNTPLAFCKNNVQMVKEALATLALPLATAKRLVSLAQVEPAQDVVTLDIAKMRQDLEHIEALDTDVETLTMMLDDVEQGVENMAEMVTHLKDFTRLDQGNLHLADLNHALHSVVYLAKSVMPNRVEVMEEYSEIPHIECTVSQLNQVFLNLITNAAHAIADTGKIWVRTRPTAAGGVQIDVQDTGSGIPEEILPKIFDLYFTTKPRGEGTGIGLHIAKDIVEQHHGTLTVQSQVGQGSVFTIILPAKMV